MKRKDGSLSLQTKKPDEIIIIARALYVYRRYLGKADCQEIKKSKEFEFHDRNEVYDDKMLSYVDTLRNVVKEL